MTTNTTKLAEAIGIISSVLADEVAQTKHFVEVEDDEELTVPVSEYNELKELITDGFPDIMTDIETLKTEVEAAVELDGPVDDDDDNDDWAVDDDDDADDAGDDAGDDAEPSAEAQIEALLSAGEILEGSKERLLATLDTVADQLNDLATDVEGLQDEVDLH